MRSTVRLDVTSVSGALTKVTDFSVDLQHRRVKRRAKRLGVSVAEVVRRCIDADLASDEPVTRDARLRRALAVCGKYADPQGPADVARDHDAALAQAYRR